ncbi:phage tail protein [Pseudomonas asiatica]|uniref:phage tail-collar fiber domain-containing protein n=1 Tax=Pseudomonas asiatica TaxID=2219225 RepID=UPI00244CD96E|nr:phage tail protein [Pseudomonas asiatica]MDH0133534.1 phage tail protein [Pseudomonas asiatica]
MSDPLLLTFTKAGLAAALRADNTGIAMEIGSVVVGTSAYTPSNSQKSLVAQVAEYPIIGGERLSDTMLHIIANADGPKAFWIKELGYKLKDGTLLAVWSHPTEALTYKSANTEVLLAYDISFAALPANSVTINSSEASLSLSLAGPLAAQAAALAAEQLAGLKRQDQIDINTEKHRVAGEVQSNLLSRMQAVEKRQDADREALLGVAISNAAAVIALQTIVLQHIHGA